MSDAGKRLIASANGVLDLVKASEAVGRLCDCIEKLERENRDLKMQAISDGSEMQMLCENIAAEKALATRLAAQLFSYMTTEYWSDGDEEVIAAYRKARGL